MASRDSFRLLFIGNSHSASNGLPELVAKMIETGLPGSSPSATLAPGFGFLSDRLADGVTQESLESRPWTHVILQGQKYSASGQIVYPTYGAEEWIRRVRAIGAQPILYPEHPREGNTEEGLRVHNLHLDIASREPACVAPVGLVWDEAIKKYPTLNLHDNDGNHSNINGATLTSFVFYQVLTRQPASGLPYMPDIGVDADTQLKLREVAATVTNKKKKRPPTVFNSSYQKRKFLRSKTEYHSPWCH